MPENLLIMNFFTHIFEGFYLDFKLFISWKDVSFFNGGEGGGSCFSDGRTSFLRGGAPHEHQFWWDGGLKKL